MLARHLCLLLPQVMSGILPQATPLRYSSVEKLSGTFLYVAFMEVIPREMERPEHGGLKLLMLCLGFGLMSLLGVWA